jgi:transcription elongation factor Elf1
VKTMTAQFSGQCSACGHRYLAGQEVAVHDGSRIHIKCAICVKDLNGHYPLPTPFGCPVCEAAKARGYKLHHLVYMHREGVTP